MGAQTLHVAVVALPDCLSAVADNPPPCFPDLDAWRGYLAACWREANSGGRNEAKPPLLAGECPNYCADCTPRYRAQQKALGRCRPHPQEPT